MADIFFSWNLKDLQTVPRGDLIRLLRTCVFKCSTWHAPGSVPMKPRTWKVPMNLPTYVQYSVRSGLRRNRLTASQTTNLPTWILTYVSLILLLHIQF